MTSDSRSGRIGARWEGVYARCIEALVTTRTLREIRRHALIYAGLTPFVVIAVFPVAWMAITAFKDDTDLYRMVGFFKALPRDLEEAALVDGCGLVGAIARVVLPLSRPGIAITTIFAFTLSMQEFLYAVVYVAARDEKTAAVGLATALIRGDIYDWGSLMAGGLVIGLPVAILYAVVIDHFIRGLTGAVTN